MTVDEANEAMRELTHQKPKTLEDFKVLLARGVELNRFGGNYAYDIFGYWLSENSEYLGKLLKS